MGTSKLRKSRKMRFLSGISWLGFTAGVTDVPVTHRVGAGKITGDTFKRISESF